MSDDTCPCGHYPSVHTETRCNGWKPRTYAIWVPFGELVLTLRCRCPYDAEQARLARAAQ